MKIGPKWISWVLAASFAVPWAVSGGDIPQPSYGDTSPNTAELDDVILVLGPRGRGGSGVRGGTGVRRGSRGGTSVQGYYDSGRRYDDYDPGRYYDEDKDRPMSRSDRLKADQEQRKRDREERKGINRQQSIRSY